MDEARKKLHKFIKSKSGKRLFSNYNHVLYSATKTIPLTSIVHIEYPVDLESILDEKIPVGSEVAAYRGVGMKPVARFNRNQGNWIGNTNNISFVIVKYKKSAVKLTDKFIEITGSGNYEQALLYVIRHKWVMPAASRVNPEWRSISGRFNVNRHIDFTFFKSELKKKVPTSHLGEIIEPLPEKIGIQALIVKWLMPKITFQFFRNGTITFSGLKNPDQMDVPKEIFRHIVEVYNVDPFNTQPGGFNKLKLLPYFGNKYSKGRHATNYKPALSYDSVKEGYYVRPGQDGTPRFYPYLKMVKAGNGSEVSQGSLDLTGVKPKVIKAFEKAGVAIPKRTRDILGITNNPVVEKKYGTASNRRAPSWNSEKPGHYVRPGVGKQPYWAKIPTGIASAKKTVIEKYKNAGRNIPKAVREIFKIGSNVKTNNGGRSHKIEMGLDGILRINGTQATRLTKKELVAISYNLNIPQANSTQTPATLIGRIINKTGVKKANKTYDVIIDGVKYKFLMTGNVERTEGKVRTTRSWDTLSSNLQSKLAKALLPANMHNNYNKLSTKNKFNAILAIKHVSKKSPINKPESPNNNNNNFAGNLEKELLANSYKNRLKPLLKNHFRNDNVKTVMNLINKLPKGIKTKQPKKGNVTRTIKNFVKNVLIDRKAKAKVATLKASIKIPNWVSKNSHNSFLNFITSNNPNKETIKKRIQAWKISHTKSPNKKTSNVEKM
jgi:hypothetical protein